MDNTAALVDQLEAIAAHINTLPKVTATVEYPGYLAVTIDVGAKYPIDLTIGTANGPWGYDVNLPSGDRQAMGDSRDDIAPEGAETETVIAGIVAAIDRLRSAYSPRPFTPHVYGADLTPAERRKADRDEHNARNRRRY